MGEIKKNLYKNKNLTVITVSGKNDFRYDN